MNNIEKVVGKNIINLFENFKVYQSVVLITGSDISLSYVQS